MLIQIPVIYSCGFGFGLPGISERFSMTMPLRFAPNLDTKTPISLN